jgi:hypothetical protein
MLEGVRQTIRAPDSGGECRDCGLPMIDGDAMNCKLAQIAEGQAANKATACGTSARRSSSLAEH